MKGLIIYKGKYGATKQYVTWLADELHLPAIALEDVDEEHLRFFDFIILAGSIYIGKWTLRDWVNDHQVLTSLALMFHLRFELILL